MILLGLSLASASAAASDPWRKQDSAWQATYFLVHAADWGQTRDIARQCQQGPYYETNPVLGECPHITKVDYYFLGTALLHYGIARALPRTYRRLFQAGTIGMQMGYVGNNASIGLNIRF